MELIETINEIWERQDTLSPNGPETDPVDQAVALLDQGKERIAIKENGKWRKENGK